MLNYISDLIFDSNIQKQYDRQGNITFGQIDRSFVVTGISGVLPNLVQSTAENYIKTIVPVTTPHPNDSNCLARYYTVKPLAAQDTVEVIVSYVFNQNPVSATQWQVESNNYPEMEETDRQWNLIGSATDSNAQPTLPIVITNYEFLWKKFTDTDPMHPPEPACRGTVQVLKPRKSWTYTKTIYSATSAQTLDDAGSTYIATVNSVPWISYTGTSYPQGTILCYNVAVSYQPYQATNTGVLNFLYHPEGWQPWSRFTSTVFPTPNLWRAGVIQPSQVVTGGLPAGTAYAANGYVQVNGYNQTNLNLLVTLI